MFITTIANPATRALIRNFTTPWKMRWYYLQKLPTLFFWRIRIRSCSPDRAVVTIPFSWRTQNPFRSTYFAALCGAAELSTGVLAIIALHQQPQMSMLITHLEADFIKKATDMTSFVCEEGWKIQDAVQRALDTGEAQQVQVVSVGKNEAGETVAKVSLTWSFKAKRQA